MRHTLLISGGGPVGLTVAALLATSTAAERCRIEIIESGAPPRWDGDDVGLRVYALSRASQRIFERLGVWRTIESTRACAYERMQVWQGENPDGRAALRFDSADLGEPDLGHIVEDRLLKHTLFERLASEPDVTLHTGRSVVAVGASRPPP